MISLRFPYEIFMQPLRAARKANARTDWQELIRSICGPYWVGLFDPAQYDSHIVSFVNVMGTGQASGRVNP